MKHPTSKHFIISLGSIIFLGAVVLGILLPNLSLYDFPECAPTPEEQRRKILEEVPYVHGNVKNITETTLIIEADFRYLNRWKCDEMRSPYEEVIGSLTKEYRIRITPETQIVPIGDPRYRYVPNDHRPEFLPEPKKILDEINTEPQQEMNLEEILRDNRIIAVTQGEPALTTDAFTATLIMVDPHRAGLYNFGIQMTIFLLSGLGIVALLNILAHYIFEFTSQKKWLIFFSGIKSGGAIGFIIWYIIQIT